MLGESLYSHYETDARNTVRRGERARLDGARRTADPVAGPGGAQRSGVGGAASAELTAVFHAATRTGRRVRTETGIGAAPDAFVDAGADLGAEALGGLEGRSAVVVGAG